MSDSKESWNAQWRASAHESVPYTDYLPECLLVLPELVDGSLAQGKAKRIAISFYIKPDGMVSLKLEDDGKGITNDTRLLSWASTKSTETHHRYGHGSKKALTKFMRDYEMAKWSISYRRCDKRGVSGSLFTLRAPFLGLDTAKEENEHDDKELMPSGTKWEFEFHQSILGKYNKPKELFQAVKELLCVRYSRKYFDQAEFVLSVRGKASRGISSDTLLESSRSHGWHTFEEGLEREIQKKNAYLLYDIKKEVDGGTMTYKEYKLTIDGKLAFDLKKDFPIYGQRNMKCSLSHIALDGRVIETMPMYKLCGREANHNDFNGRISFVNFIPNEADPKAFEKFPTPCTTKVSFYPNCPKFQKLLSDLADIYKTPPAAEPVEPAPKPKLKLVRAEPATQILSVLNAVTAEPRGEPAAQILSAPSNPAPSNPARPPSPPPPPANPIPIPKPKNPFLFSKSPGSIPNTNFMSILEDTVEIAKIQIPSSIYASWATIMETYSLKYGRERFREFVKEQQTLLERYIS